MARLIGSIHYTGRISWECLPGLSVIERCGNHIHIIMTNNGYGITLEMEEEEARALSYGLARMVSEPNIKGLSIR